MATLNVRHVWPATASAGYSVFQLKEIQKRFQILKKGNHVLDLGCAPGGWLQVIARQVGAKGRVVGLDRLKVKSLPFPQVTTIRGDIGAASVQQQIRDLTGGSVRVVTSDLSPDLTGIRFQDHIHSCELVRLAFSCARDLLAPEGIFLAKIFQGEDLEAVVQEIKGQFKQIKRVIPAASRKTSTEIYLLAKGFRPSAI